jgi:predicted transcriptional regulator
MIKRSKHTTDYTVIPNAIMEDKDLDCECLGMLTYLIGKPSNWKIQAEFLGKRFGWGKTKVYGILKKLINAGYVTRKANIVDGLKRGSEYTVYDRKMAEKPHCSQTRTSEAPIVRKDERIISNNNISYTLKEKIYKKEKGYENDLFLQNWFKEFDKEYPRSNKRSTWQGGSKIYEKFKRVLKGGVSFDELMKGLRLYKQDQTVKDGYAKNVLTWLNQEGWSYEPPQAEQVIPFSIKQDDDFVLKQWQEEGKEWFRIHLKRRHDQALHELIADGKITQEEYDSV